MTERATAVDQLERILYLLPVASREGGVGLVDAAEALGVSVSTVQRDIEDMTARAFYHPPGSADLLQISLEVDCVKIWSCRKFNRPPKLSRREALALSIGLRAAAADLPPARRQALLDLALRLDGELSVSASEDLWPRYSVEEGPADDHGLRALIQDAVRDRRVLRMRYLKPGDEEPADRVVRPYAVVYASGRWYVLGDCAGGDGIRAFRLDRVLQAEATDGVFEAPLEFDVGEYVDGGRVFRSDEEAEACVRYSPTIAAWIREQGPCEELPDGSVAVRFPVADPGWLVRHVLRHGPEAEVIEPDGVRALVVAALTRIAARH